MNKIRIFIADDHALVRSGLIKLLEPFKEFIIVGEASDGEEAVALVKKIVPDVVVIDLSMPKLSGIEATKQICASLPSVKVLVLTMHDNEEYVYQILKSGASGYMLKDSGREELALAIRTVAKGEKFFSKRITELMLASYMKKSAPSESSHNDDELPLTKREKEILYYIAAGLNNSQIGEKLFISPRTVDTHRTNIMQKLNIHDAPNLVRFALRKKDILSHSL
jgi:two-component system, NarL family, response regulator NreC